MANKLEAAGSGSRIRDKIFRSLGWGRGALGAIARKSKWQAAGTPAVDAASQDTYPVALGDLAWDYTNSLPYICTVVPAANTAATFVKLVA